RAVPLVERASDGYGHERRIRDGGEGDEDRAVGKLGAQVPRQVQGEACLAGASRTGQRQEPRGILLLLHVADLTQVTGCWESEHRAGGLHRLFAPDEWRGGLG